MFCADEDDASLKTPIVRPNDVLDIEISPVVRATPSTWPQGFQHKNSLQKTPLKVKVKDKKVTRMHNSSVSKKQLASPMKRGDPFLPSVFPDENPIADYSVKKNSRKKPSDCKCKGFGYNLSPSALLPEEMRQQWGVGMFGKPTLAKTSSLSLPGSLTTPMAIAPTTRDMETKCTPPNVGRNAPGCSSSSCCVLRCKNCMKEPCLCSEFFTKHEGFRIPDNSERRKQKSSTKGSSFKGKETKTQGPLVLGSTTSALKRIACYNSKDNSNIISTSNFHRGNAGSFSVNGHTASPAEVNGYKCGISLAQNSIAGSRCSGFNGNVTCGVKTYSGSSNREDIALTPRVRHRHQPGPPRRLLTNITSSPILSSTSLSGATSAFESKAPLSRSGAQMLMLGTQGCACDSCRRRASLMSRMEALSFSTSHAQQMLSPFLFSSSQRYQTASLHSSVSSTGRYAPYGVPSYGYTRTPSRIYRSPERYHCFSPPYLDYTDSPGRRRQPVPSTPLSMAQEMSKVDMSFLDTDSAVPSPPTSGYVDDITDLSIKDTVDFFVSMKSPFVNSSPSPSSDASSGIYSSLSPGERSSSPNYNNSSGSCFCNSAMCASSYSLPPPRRENSYGEPSSHKFTGQDGTSQPMSLLYSSLVSDLEDELRCAIENIPTS